MEPLNQNQTNHNDVKYFKSTWELEVKTAKLPKARENASHQIAIGVSFSSDWLREWCEFSGPITARSSKRNAMSGYFRHPIENYSIRQTKQFGLNLLTDRS